MENSSGGWLGTLALAIGVIAAVMVIGVLAYNVYNLRKQRKR